MTAAVLYALTFLICLPVAGGLTVQTAQKLAATAHRCGGCGRVYCNGACNGRPR